MFFFYIFDLIDLIFGVLTPLSAISWRPVLVVEEAGVPGENHWPWASNWSGLDINVCPIPVKTDVGQVDLVLQLSDGTSEKIRFSNVQVRRTNLFPLV